MAQNFTGKKTMEALESGPLKKRLQAMGIVAKDSNGDIETVGATKPKPLNGNEPCHCGSGIRFDLCCGKVDY